MIAWIRTASLALIGGWLAQCFAATDDDVDASVAHYDAKAYDEALAALDAAQARLGERPELSLNRGLILLAKNDREGAKRSFEHASEATDHQIAASGFYQLGNLAMDEEDWEGAIEHYIDALKMDPEHHHAKWNLELALARKEQGDSSSSHSSSSDTDSSNTGSDSSNSSDSNSSESTGESSSQNSDDSTAQDSSSNDSNGSEGSSDSSGENSDSGDQGSSSGEQNSSPNSAPASDPSTSSAAPPSQIDRADLDKMLEQLDREDNFNFGAPRQDAAPVEKDW
jgi:tetratricopeptide (TPR) repeat protein